MPSWFRKKKDEMVMEDQIRAGPYVPPPERENQVQTANVPPEMEPLFSKAEEYVGKFFDDIHWDPTKGTITIGGNRYILINAESFRRFALRMILLNLQRSCKFKIENLNIQLIASIIFFNNHLRG